MNAKAIVARLASGIHNIFLVSNSITHPNHVQRNHLDPLQAYVGFNSYCRIAGELFRIAIVRDSMSVLRCGRKRYSLPSFLIRDRNGCTDRLARDSGQENRQARPSLCACLWPRSGAHRGRSRIASNVRKLLFRVDLSDFRWSNRPYPSRSPCYSIRGEIAKRFHAHGKMGTSGPRRTLSNRVLNPPFSLSIKTLSEHLSLC